MNRIFVFLVKFLVVVGLYAGLPVVAQASDLCDPQEKVLFSCKLQKSQKEVALCSSANLTKQSGYLQYRFGKPGSFELEFPSTRHHSQSRFLYSNYARYQVSYTSIAFESGAFRYAIFDSYSGEDGKTRQDRGVEVSKQDGGHSHQLLCQTIGVISDLGNLESVLPCDAESAISDCSPEQNLGQ